jgi:zinc transporter ZupT
MTNVLDHAALEGVAEQAIGHYGWMLVAAFSALLFKDILFNFAQGILIYYGSD